VSDPHDLTDDELSALGDTPVAQYTISNAAQAVHFLTNFSEGLSPLAIEKIRDANYAGWVEPVRFHRTLSPRVMAAVDRATYRIDSDKYVSYREPNAK
jgi:hypothetical protein